MKLSHRGPEKLRIAACGKCDGRECAESKSRAEEQSCVEAIPLQPFAA